MNGKPMIDKKTILIWVEGEETAEDIRTGRVYNKKEVEHLCVILSIEKREVLEMIKNLCSSPKTVDF